MAPKMDILGNILTGFAFLSIVMSWFAFSICLMKFAALLQKAGPEAEQNMSFNPAIPLFRSCSDAVHHILAETRANLGAGISWPDSNIRFNHMVD